MSAGTEHIEFPFELVVDVEHRQPIGQQTRDAMYALAVKELRKLTKGHSDIVGANISIKAPHENVSIPLYEATVTVVFSPKNMAATETAKDPMAALRAALRAVEREVRSTREKRRGY
jgi:ribosome-associated translation inhibitor RaiA